MDAAVLDANVLVPGFVNAQGVAGRIVTAWQSALFELVTSEHIIGETGRALRDPYYLRRISETQIQAALLLLRRRATVTELTVLVRGVATHPEDDLVLSAALSAPARYLVTRDKRLQEIRSHEGILIVPPPAFLQILGATGDGTRPET